MSRFGNRLVMVVVTLVVAVCGVRSSRAQEPGVGRKYALLVGVRRYEKDQLRSLKYTENDVNALAEVLRDGGYKRVVLMTQTEGAENPDRLPTAAKVREALKGLLESCRQGDTVVIAFSGHGVQFKDQKESYFCPMDARLSDPKSLVSLSEVYKELESCKASARLLLVDACRNDPQSDASKDATGEKLESVTRPQAQRPPGGVAVLFSCSEGQKSFEDEKLKHGVFFHFVIEGLKGKAAEKKGAVSLLAIANYASREVEDYVKDNIGDRLTQRPNLVGDTSGQFALITGQPAPKEIVSKTLPGLKLVRIPAAGKSFTMGTSEKTRDFIAQTYYEGKAPGWLDEEAAHKVTLTKDYYLGVHEVTRGQFRKFVKDAEYQTEAEADGKGGSGYDSAKRAFFSDAEYTWKNTGFFQSDDHPVVNVSWNDAVAFCKWLSEKDGREYRLPREAEWEFACRAGSKSWFHFGSDEDDLAKYANVADLSLKAKWNYSNLANKEYQKLVSGWFDRVSWDDGYAFTAPVGSFKPNSYGLYDMHGNAWEWCADWYAKYPQAAVTDPRGSEGGSGRVVRGGSWGNNPLYCRAALRDRDAPTHRADALGFRLSVPVR